MGVVKVNYNQTMHHNISEQGKENLETNPSPNQAWQEKGGLA